MPGFYVARRPLPNGEHEVHREDCAALPPEAERIYLGDFDACRHAVATAALYFELVNGCRLCAMRCHRV